MAFGSLTIPNYSVETNGSIAMSKPATTTTASSSGSAYSGGFNTSNASSTIACA